MIVILKIAVVIFALLFLIRRKWDLGLVLFLDSALIAVLFGLDVRTFAVSAGAALVGRETLELVGIVILVLYLGNFLQAGGNFKRMVDALKNLVRDPRWILAIPSAFIGLLPMTAGAMMGAPIVDEAARRWKLTPAWKTFFNYWFRHVWEYSWPLYVNLILTAAIFRVPILRICLAQFPFTLLAVGIGLFVLFRYVPRVPAEAGTGRSFKDIVRVFGSIWPIFLTILLIFVFRIDMLLALGAAAVLTQVFARMDLAARWAVVRQSFAPKIIILTAMVMIFKKILEVSGALEAVVRVFPPQGAWAYVLLFAAPFLIGLLTGVNQAFPAIAFPLLLPIVGQGKPDLVLILFAYVSGFCGILLSPAHLCLALTADYFQAELRAVYRLLALPVAVIFGAALLALIVLKIL
jgi:integral membrane protein (TIGR00529 family)